MAIIILWRFLFVCLVVCYGSNWSRTCNVDQAGLKLYLWSAGIQGSITTPSYSFGFCWLPPLECQYYSHAPYHTSVLGIEHRAFCMLGRHQQNDISNILFMFSLPSFIEQVFAECLLCAADAYRSYKYTHTYACMRNRKLPITCSLTNPNNLYFISYKLRGNQQFKCKYVYRYRW